MKRLCIVVSLTIVLCATNSFAQIRALSIGGGIDLPMGTFSNSAGAGPGVTVRAFYEYEGLENILLTGSVGYYSFGGKTYEVLGYSTGYEYKWTVLPITSGGRYYFGEEEAKTRPFVGGEVGIHIYSVSLNDDGGVSSGAVLAGSTEFALVPMVGVQLGALDLYAEYSLSEFNYFGLKGAFKFSVGKK